MMLWLLLRVAAFSGMSLWSVHNGDALAASVYAALVVHALVCSVTQAQHEEEMKRLEERKRELLIRRAWQTSTFLRKGSYR